MLVNESLAEYLVRQFDALHERADKAERERDDLRAEQAEHDEQIARMESKFSLAKRALDSKTARCDRTEAELARRDAAAGEPFAYIDSAHLDEFGWGYVFKHSSPMRVACESPVYTDAPPAVLPPEVIEPAGEYCLDDRKGFAWLAGANWMREQCLELGAQQQKVVELPDPADDSLMSTWQFNDAVINALDAANVKWEVKK